MPSVERASRCPLVAVLRHATRSAEGVEQRGHLLNGEMERELAILGDGAHVRDAGGC